MAITSTLAHQKVYVRAKGYEMGLMDVEKLIIAITDLEISLPLKKRMLVHALWEITKLKGDFKGRFRSGSVLILGLPIERDHVYQKERIVRRLLEQPNQIKIILNDSVHCVVTREEHQRLTRLSESRAELDGWQRYHEAGIEVWDMLTGEKIRGEMTL